MHTSSSHLTIDYRKGACRCCECFTNFLFLLSFPFRSMKVITWFQNRRAKLKRDMEELKKDVESVKLLTTQKSFLENVNDMNLLKSKATHTHDHHNDNMSSTEKFRSIAETDINH